MKRVYADAGYWVALASRHDQLHVRARQVSRSLNAVQIVTSEEVLTEFLAYFCERGRTMREAAVRFVEGILTNPGIVVRAQSHQTFADGFALFRSRPDKGYSLTDCISILAMRQEAITEVLTQDEHFAQEGFIRLL